MSSLFASGLAADLVLALLGLEAALLYSCRRLAGIGPGLGPVAGSLLAGACLALALRAALMGAAWPWVATALGAALAAHLVDLHQRRAAARPWTAPP